jgi:hypothetical protein
VTQAFAARCLAAEQRFTAATAAAVSDVRLALACVRAYAAMLRTVPASSAITTTPTRVLPTISSTIDALLAVGLAAAGDATPVGAIADAAAATAAALADAAAGAVSALLSASCACALGDTCGVTACACAALTSASTRAELSRTEAALVRTAERRHAHARQVAAHWQRAAAAAAIAVRR